MYEFCIFPQAVILIYVNNIVVYLWDPFQRDIEISMRTKKEAERREKKEFLLY